MPISQNKIASWKSKKENKWEWKPIRKKVNIDKLEIMNREVSQNQLTHGFLILQTKTSFRHLTKHITYKTCCKRKRESRKHATCKKKNNERNEKRKTCLL